MAAIKRFEDLEVWQIARELCRLVKRITSKGAIQKDFTLVNQIKGSSGSAIIKGEKFRNRKTSNV